MKTHYFTFDHLACIKGQVKQAVYENQLEVPCRVIATIPYMRYGKEPIEYKFDFLIEQGASQYGMVAHEIDNWIEKVESPKTLAEILNEFPDEEIAEVLAQRLKQRRHSD
ncbi:MULTISPECIES: hypothetical protein [Aneurinibacillus]|uniref:Uncharacterized protein n=1 Tax=Aneurinibacillus thermoaerophilus TaxID=143495 RepID=A0ABX8YCV0_ANETH|nr:MULTISPECIES: hypothetical protein [Aneurinibacillus]AMA74034.1 hypothetical protein ACH33_15090 [Aneurinibacillus sp. XH2]MED0675856.1 hypothetical protein [Aneurinibacillus thermoaerophilus]MED0737236.1 hypothetical protein [Aneurinibacillus thermoaerophilus]QYY43380.1 hypothetical protein K3F53_03770 [Aneurinibacillus thermoaerophilus]